jgi:hypothetical protein
MSGIVSKLNNPNLVAIVVVLVVVLPVFRMIRGR